jgi:hypothetical protein
VPFAITAAGDAENVGYPVARAPGVCNGSPATSPEPTTAARPRSTLSRVSHQTEPSLAGEPVTPGGAGRSKSPASPLARIGFVVFGIGLLAVAVILVLFATGSTELPLWLNLVALLAPLGFGVGLLGVFLEARESRAQFRDRQR